MDYFSDVDDSAQVDLVHIIKWDASSWTTDRDVDANDSPATVPQIPGGMAILSDKLYVVFSATASNLADGFIMQKSADAGSWSKVATDNFAGPIAVLVTRS